MDSYKAISHIISTIILLLLLLTAGACRLKVISKYPRQFCSPADAERHYFQKESSESPMTVEELPTKHSVSTQTKSVQESTQICVRLRRLFSFWEGSVKKLQIMADCFSKFASSNYGVHINPDFLQLSLSASCYLKQCKRENVVYGVAKAVGRMRPDDSDSRLPAKRMPMGLLEHMLNFFNADSYSQVGMHCHGANKVARPCMSHSYHCSIVQISSAFIQMPTLIKGIIHTLRVM